MKRGKSVDLFYWDNNLKYKCLIILLPSPQNDSTKLKNNNMTFVHDKFVVERQLHLVRKTTGNFNCKTRKTK